MYATIRRNMLRSVDCADAIALVKTPIVARAPESVIRGKSIRSSI